MSYTEKNVPFTRNEIKEHFSKSKTPLVNEYPNRRERRLSAQPVKHVRNNRRKTKARFSNTLLNKMSYFYLQLNSKKGMAKYAKTL